MTCARTLRQALTRADCLRTGWPWRAVAYPVSGALTGYATCSRCCFS
ncbi:hypothetical protein [Streptomyces sp. Wb2n-11]|nr:hypothetical protein [Streptomyces sp. Wb2n-11]